MPHTYEIVIIDCRSGKVNKTLTRFYNDSLNENVEGMRLPKGYRIELNKKY